jgi:tripartite-type tricarboxylate transporter receptor subunit TctC
MTLIRSGQVRALGHTMPKRSPILGDIPPIAETFPGFSYSGWNGLIAPKRTPPAILRKAHDTMVSAVSSPEVRREFEQQLAEIQLTGGPEFRTFVASEIRENGKLVQAAGLKPE